MIFVSAGCKFVEAVRILRCVVLT